MSDEGRQQDWFARVCASGAVLVALSAVINGALVRDEVTRLRNGGELRAQQAAIMAGVSQVGSAQSSLARDVKSLQAVQAQVVAWINARVETEAKAKAEAERAAAHRAAVEQAKRELAAERGVRGD